ncbi:MAG: hypothetical protein ACTSWG_10275 [Candidatus Helarchaeota archaeon]
MSKGIFKINDKAYTVRDWKIMEMVVVAIINVEDKDGKRVEYKVRDISDNEHIFPEGELIANFDVAKELALQNWQALVKNMTNEIESFTVKNFDKMKRKIQKNRKKRKK